MYTGVAGHIQGIGLHALPKGNYSLGRYTLLLRKPLEEMRGGFGAAAQTRIRPLLANYVLDKARMHFVNFCEPASQRAIYEAGLGCVPCGNPKCFGSGGGRWDTEPCQWSCETSAPQVPPTPAILPMVNHSCCDANCE